MNKPDTHRKVRTLSIMCAALLAVAALPLLSSARANPISTSVTITNNSSHEIRHVYLSPVNSDDWSGDQISSAIGAGQSLTLSNVACSGESVKVIGEDQDGCFSSTVVSCDQSSTWTVTDATARDCGY